MVEDVDATCSDRHTQTNLACTLSDTHIHDVHNTNTTHDERYASHTTQEYGHHVGCRVHHAGKFLLRTDVEIVVIGSLCVCGILQFVVATQHFCYFINSLACKVFGYGRAGDTAEKGLCLDAFHYRCVWGQHQVVLVHTHRVVTLLLQYADNTKRNRIESNNHAYRVGAVGEEIVYNRLSEYAHFGTRLDVGIGEHLAFVNRQLSNLQIILIDTIDARRRVVVAVNPLSATVHGRAYALDEVALVLNRLVVGEL